MTKYKLLYPYGKEIFYCDVVSIDLLNKTVKISQHPVLSELLGTVELPYTKSNIVEFTKYCCRDDNNNEVELYENDEVYIPGFWKGTIKKQNNIFVISLDDKDRNYINMHEMYSELRENTTTCDCYMIPSLRKL